MHIFISYAKRDTHTLALQLRDFLNTLPNVTAWMDESLLPADSWASQIQDEIDRADYMVVLLSPDVNRPVEVGQRRSFVLNEIDYAQQENKPIIPVMAQKTKIPVQLAGIQYVDLSLREREELEELVDYVCSHAGITSPFQVTEFSTGKIQVMPAHEPVVVIRSSPRYRKRSRILLAVILAALVVGVAWLILRGSVSKSSVGYPDQASVISNSQWTPVSQMFSGVEMSLVPTGCFTMGSTDGDTDESPQTKICFDAPFWIDRYETTNSQYGSEGGFSGANYPREAISWFDAKAFCERRAARLPTEAEWEYAARGPDNLIYPWGNKFDPAKGNFCDKNCDRDIHDSSYDDGFPWTAPVGSFPEGQSWVGAQDMSGNVMEWVSTLRADYPYRSNDGREDLNDIHGLRSVRGGSWYDDAHASRASYRTAFAPTDNQEGDIGFRCARPYTS